jgi:diguanylate cyclase (GGDEF)-like protein/PAS domain S-box-containing protein
VHVQDLLKRWLRWHSPALLLGAGVSVGTLLLSLGAVVFAHDGSEVAAWWPAAGFGVGAAVLVRPSHRWVVLVSVLIGSSIGNYVGGRTLAISAAFAMCNTLEVALTGWMLTRAGRSPALRTMEDLGRLLLAILAGAILIGFTAALTVVVFLEGELLSVWRSVTPSHAAAQLLIVPVALAWFQLPRFRRLVETAVQSAVLVVATWAAFASSHLPLEFVALPVVVWAAARLGIFVTTVQLLLLGVAATVLTARGLGPFAIGSNGIADAVASTLLLQAFVAVTSVAALALVGAVGQHADAMIMMTMSERLYRTGFRQSLLGMMLLTQEEGNLRVQQANPIADQLLGPSGEPIEGALLYDRLRPEDRLSIAAAVEQILAGSLNGWHGEVAVLDHASGLTIRWLQMALAELPDTDTESPSFTAQLVDVTDRRHAEEQLATLALHDPLTGLANRIKLLDRVEVALAGGRHHGEAPALLFCDLDDFKEVNDQGGHQAGDTVLVEIARRLERLSRETDTVARLGGDEFVLLCPEPGSLARITSLADRICEALELPIRVGEQTFTVSASVGIARGRPHDTAAQLLRYADTAMYAAKAQGKGRAVVFDEAITDERSPEAPVTWRSAERDADPIVHG